MYIMIVLIKLGTKKTAVKLKSAQDIHDLKNALNHYLIAFFSFELLYKKTRVQ